MGIQHNTTLKNKFPNNVSSPIIRFSYDGTLLSSNEAAKGLLRTYRESHPDPIPPTWKNTILSVAKHPEHTEVIQQLGDHTYSCMFIPAPDKKIVMMYGVDITTRVYAEKATTDSDEQLRSLIASIDDLVFTVDLAGSFLVYHQAAHTLHDTPITPSKRFIGKSYDQVLPSEMSAPMAQAIEQVKATLRTAHFEYSLAIDHEMRYFSARVSPLISPSIKLTGFTIVSSDITTAKQARQRQQHLLELEQLHRSITTLFLKTHELNDAIEQALALVGHSLDVSRAYLFNYDRSSAPFNLSHEWCAPDVTSQLQQRQSIPFDQLAPKWLPTVSAEDISASYFDMTQLPDKAQATLAQQGVQNVMVLPFYIDQRLCGFVGLDETRYERQWLPEEGVILRAIVESYTRMLERYTTQRELISARDTALQSAQFKSEFISNISHELRTPLMHILGTLDLLDETTLDKTQHGLVDAALTSAHHLLNVINDVLDFSQLERGKLALDSEPLDIRAILREIEVLMQPQASAKQIDFAIHVSEKIPQKLLGDPVRLRQALGHLVGNGIKFTPSGSVEVHVQPAAVLNNMMSLRFLVRDTGIGIAPEHHKQIFNSFEQADGSTTRRYGGTGLGLAIAQQLVKLMGGTIRLKSDQGKGSEFEFTLMLQMP